MTTDHTEDDPELSSAVRKAMQRYWLRFELLALERKVETLERRLEAIKATVAEMKNP